MDEKRTYKTNARTKIMEYLQKNRERSVTVQDIMNNMTGENSEVNISTVYRYLGKLSKEGLVNKYVADKGEMALYQYAGSDSGCEHHIHMQCVKCGKILHLECGFMDTIAGHIKEHHGFDIMCKGSILYGTCDDCQEEGVCC